MLIIGVSYFSKEYVYEHLKIHEQQLVYVALSRPKSLQGLYISNRDNNRRFYLYRGKQNQELNDESKRLERHRLKFIGDTCRDFLDRSTQPDDTTSFSL